jgi:tetratricopeptide (TPR) repeat protein
MSNSTIAKSLFLKGESSFVGLAEIISALHRVKSQKTLDCVASEAIEVARRARLIRRPELCESASALVLDVPASPSLHAVAEYYQATSHRIRFADVPKSREMLTHCADYTAPEYLPRVILEIGATYDSQGDASEAVRYYLEADRAAETKDPLTRTQALWNVAFLRSLEGDHQGAVEQMEALFALVCSLSHVYPATYPEYLNNLAVVLCRAGLVERAERAVDAALASPFADRFPEWHETKTEIAEAAAAEPHKISPTLRIAPARLPAAQSGKDTRPEPVAERAPAPLRLARLLGPEKAIARTAAGNRVVTRSSNLLVRNVFFLYLIWPIRCGPCIPIKAVSDRSLAPILKRYIKTARTRGPP